MAGQSFISSPAFSAALRKVAEPMSRYRQFVQTPEQLAEAAGITVGMASAVQALGELDREDPIFSGAIGRISNTRIIEDNHILFSPSTVQVLTK